MVKKLFTQDFLMIHATYCTKINELSMLNENVSVCTSSLGEDNVKCTSQKNCWIKVSSCYSVNRLVNLYIFAFDRAKTKYKIIKWNA